MAWPIRAALPRAASLAWVVASAGCHLVADIEGIDPTPAPATPPTTGPEVVWVRQLGDGSDQRISALAIDPSGNVLVGGMFEGTLTIGATTLTNFDTSDPFLAKLDANGDAVWAQGFADTTSVVVTGLATGESGEPVLAGYFDGTMEIGGETLVANGAADTFVAVFDAAGTPRWARHFGDGGEQRAYGVVATTGTSVLLAGEFRGALEFPGEPVDAVVSAGDMDAYLVGYGDDGTLAFAERFGDGSFQSAGALAIDGANDVYLAGTTRGPVDLGHGAAAPKGLSDLFVARMRSNGEPVWSGLIDDAEAQANCFDVCEVALAAAPDDTVVMAAAFYGELTLGPTVVGGGLAADIVIAKLRQQGQTFEPVWAKGLGDGARVQRPYGLAVGPDGTIALAGVNGGVIDLGGGAVLTAGDDPSKNAFVALFGPDGAFRSAVTLPVTSAADDPDRPHGPRVAVDPWGDVVVAGSFSGAIEIAGHHLESVGGDNDAFVVKLRMPR